MVDVHSRQSVDSIIFNNISCSAMQCVITICSSTALHCCTSITITTEPDPGASSAAERWGGKQFKWSVTAVRLSARLSA